MALERGTFSGTLAADSYRSLADLFGLGTNAIRIVGGTIQAQENGATYLIVPRGTPPPATSSPGSDIVAGAGIGLQASDGWRLDEVWVRNSAAGANARLVYTGTLET